MRHARREHVFPPPLDRHYPIREGRIHTRSLEAHIVDHCNLTCADCCSLSPLLAKWFCDPDTLTRDLTRAKRVLAPRIFKLVGGEPLLHPRLLELIECVRRSGIAPRVSLTTNGLLLGRMPESIWQALDAMTISIYPKPGLKPGLIETIETRAERFDVALNWKYQNTFAEMNRKRRTNDEAATRSLFKDCWIRERCHMIRQGVFYTCTRPPHFDAFYQGKHDFSEDGLRLHDGTSLFDEMHDYLYREKPLEACFHCRGGNSTQSAHRLMRPAEIRERVANRS